MTIPCDKYTKKPRGFVYVLFRTKESMEAALAKKSCKVMGNLTFDFISRRRCRGYLYSQGKCTQRARKPASVYSRHSNKRQRGRASQILQLCGRGRSENFPERSQQWTSS